MNYKKRRHSGLTGIRSDPGQARMTTVGFFLSGFPLKAGMTNVINMILPQSVSDLLGLTTKQAQAYLGLIELGSATVGDIAKKAGLKRPTTYLALEELNRRGYVQKTSKRGVVAYSAESPARLVDTVGAQLNGLKVLIPTLESMFRQQTGKPSIQFYEGKEAMHALYLKIYHQPKIYFWGTARSVDPTLHKEFESAIQKNNPTVYDLLEDSPTDRLFRNRIKALKTQNYHIRFLPKGTSFAIDCAIVGSKIFFFSYTPEFVTVVIESRNIAASLLTLYQLAWQAATPVLN